VNNLIDEIKEHEGYRSHAYRDSERVWTIGYGLNLEDGISEPLAAKILEWIVDERRDVLFRLFSFWTSLTQARQEVLVEMAYNLGVPRLLGFRRMLAAAKAGNVEAVCREMKESKWYGQVGARADRLIEKYRNG